MWFALVAIWQFRHASVHMDTVRDWAQALSIAQGEPWPSLGPNIGGLFHLGPVWFLVLSLPLCLGGSWPAVATWVGCLFATQFWWAYRLAERVRPGSGALACAALTLPNGAVVYLAGTTHTVLIVPTVLACLLAHRWFAERATAFRAFILGLSVALALHAHPTTGLLGVTAALVVLCNAQQRARCLLAWAAGVLVLFVPVWMSGAVGVGALPKANFAARGREVFSVGWAAMATPVRAQWELLPQARTLSAVAATIWGVGLALLILGAWRAVRRAPRQQWWWLGLAVAVVAISVVLATLSREFVTYYMVGLVSAGVPLLFAWGWSYLPSRTYGAISTVALMLYAAFAVAAVKSLHDEGFSMNIARVVYLGKPHDAPPWSLQPMWPATTLPAFAARLCDGSLGSLHGPAVPGADLVVDVLMAQRCAQRPRPMLGGSDLHHAWVGVPCSLVPSAHRTGAVCWHRPTFVSSMPFAPADRKKHPPRQRARSPTQTMSFAHTLQPGEWLTVTQHRMEWAATHAWSIARPTTATVYAPASWWRAFHCPESAAAPCMVQGSVLTNDRDGLGVAVFAP